MDRPNRPYRGLANEIAEREAKQAAAAAATQFRDKDSVIDAARVCLIIGGAGSVILIGFPFFGAAFVLGIYAMATHRIKQGAIISILAIIIPIGLMLLLQLLWIGFFATILKAGFSSMPTPPSL